MAVHHRDAGLGALLADDMGLGNHPKPSPCCWIQEKMKNSSTELEIGSVSWTFSTQLCNDILNYFEGINCVTTSLINNWRSKNSKFAQTFNLLSIFR